MSCSNFYILINQFSFHPRISGIRTHPALAGVRPSITIILWYYSIRLFRHPGNPHETRLPEKRSLHFIEILLYFIEISLHFVEIWLYFVEISDTLCATLFFICKSCSQMSDLKHVLFLPPSSITPVAGCPCSFCVQNCSLIEILISLILSHFRLFQNQKKFFSCSHLVHYDKRRKDMGARE